jgi:hypothetical protein
MATFNYTVDTQPMAAEISSVSNHIKGTTAAVVTMQSAVIGAEERAAEHVCSNVNRGFFTLIRSQISQKMAKLQSEVDSHLMQLNQQRRQLLGIRGRMERDYNMISGRYLKLFNGLNANLKQRIYELDKPTMDFAMREMDKASNRTKYLTATVPLTQLESLAVSQKIVASNVKYRGLKVIDSMSHFLENVNAQRRLTDKILLRGSYVASNAILFAPVVVSEWNIDKSDSAATSVTVSRTMLNPSTRSSIINTVSAAVGDNRWSVDKNIDSEITSEFAKIQAASNASQRVKEMTSRLFAAGNFRVLKNEAL